MNPIAKKIQEARIKAKMTEKELAKKCGLSAGYIMQIESGKKIINENAADMILAVFGETMESSYAAYLEENERKAEPVKAAPKVTAPVKPIPAAAAVQVEPTAQWAGALANIIKQFPVKDVRTDKAVGHKELPVLNKKIDDIPWEKLLFFKASDEEASGLRIKQGDILWVQETAAIQTEGVYLIELQGRKQFFRVQKKTGQLVLSRGPADPKPLTVDVKAIRIIGRCVRVEFML